MKHIIVALLLFFSYNISAQEFNCQVDIVAPTLKTDAENTLIFEQLKKNVFEFMNDRKWTSDVFKANEKIESSILITVNSRVKTRFSATIQITSRRPIFNSSYNSPLVNTLDKSFDFEFQLNAPMIYNEEVYSNNLTSVLAFYAYYMIGMDYDSYKLEGGSKYFRKALNIANLAQSSGEKGWSASGGKENNRYWIIENILSTQFKEMRKCIYEYHRLGLDLAYESSEKGVDGVTKALTYLLDVHQKKPLSVNMRLFFVAKVDEIVNVYSEASTKNKDAAFNLVRRLDPVNMTKYQGIIRRR